MQMVLKGILFSSNTYFKAIFYSSFCLQTTFIIKKRKKFVFQP